MQPQTFTDTLRVSDEEARLAALAQCAVLGSGPEEDFDSLARLAAQLCHAPIALVSLVDRDRVWFKARVGMSLHETARKDSFCAHTILNPRQVFTVPDAQADPRFKDYSLVAEFPKVRFYAGVPVLTPDHQAVGTVCVMDYAPRLLAPEQADVLLMLAQQAGARLQLRGALAKIESLTSQYWDEFENRKRAEDALRAYAVTDELTGLYTLRGLQVVASQYLNAAYRYHRTFSVIDVDIDGLDRINAAHGHHTGTAVLNEVAHLLKTSFRCSDILSRVNGDEFFILAAEAGPQEAELMQTRLEAKFAEHNWQNDCSCDVTASIVHFSVEPPERPLLEELLLRARNQRLALRH